MHSLKMLSWLFCPIQTGGAQTRKRAFQPLRARQKERQGFFLRSRCRHGFHSSTMKYTPETQETYYRYQYRKLVV